MENFWPTCLSRLEQELSTQQFNTWIKPLSAEIDGNTVRLVAPNRFVMQWVKERFLKKIEQFAYELKLTDIQIDFTISNNDSDAESKSSTVKSNAKIDFTHKINLLESQVATRNSPLKAQHKKINDTVKNNSGLNSDFNFDNYVTGRANQLARAAAIQVAENPGNAYNPLFIYGGVGLGKTHLLQAIGNELKLHNPDAKIRYLHAERYVSDVVKAYEHKAFDEF
ncbi:MAG: DnaA/Hda family protein, partial [Methylotenera sp.]|nr:DnaA/Hda family protein [Methylotenera sp.]